MFKYFTCQLIGEKGGLFLIFVEKQHQNNLRVSADFKYGYKIVFVPMPSIHATRHCSATRCGIKISGGVFFLLL